jgi:hypothetical protein
MPLSMVNLSVRANSFSTESHFKAGLLYKTMQFPLKLERENWASTKVNG